MRYGIFVSLFSALIFLSCNNDDDGGVERVPPRALSEVAPENDNDIQEFLQTHFYNYEEFQSPPANFDYKIKIDTIAGDNAGKTPLSDMVRSTTVKISSNQLSLDTDEDDVPHKLYYLSARPTFEELDDMGANPAVGAYPTVADSVYVRYEGKLLDGTSFDGSFFNPIWFDLARLQDFSQGARGFSEGIPFLKTGGEPIDNGDGTVSVEEYGVGMIIFPSALGFYNNASMASIPTYSPLLFTIDLFTMNQTDHDNDGIPSIDEDVNGNGYLYDDNTDQDEEDRLRTPRYANFLDGDDDGDGVSTRSEITNEDGEIVPPYPDSNNDGTPDYLDPDN
ncbi:MAG: hypothetical protein RIM83_08815 [Allomuricauda sp.]